MKHTISVLVENKAGVLSRISGLFARRGFNIDSLAVGTTEDKQISRITLLVDGDDYIAEQVTKQLNKQIDVIKVRKLNQDEITRRELALVKVKMSVAQRGEIIDIVKIMEGKIVDISHTTLTVEMSDRPEKIDLLIELLSHYNLQEVARTGTIALQKGADIV
ncbi:acetolactate synthase small subunit [Sinanaerobacter chloroacetimidivorans]|jgi:acetolactate synthase-1/3 small subunit|uniref:Acetolactate synthase small subunit n=1 Tax=Sinanaerobacter chloroacetimidivorans TaxID=2818044 RepID=A0A8J8B2V1_9FIRM|nr:acetolactate synthase small subunit [Sinanaerobacter chloroacetimidivorans]MBR0597625.1 acetolactate synthase small subunit [Sinanaerobacter chloroacetimidivorans]